MLLKIIRMRLASVMGKVWYSWSSMVVAVGFSRRCSTRLNYKTVQEMANKSSGKAILKRRPSSGQLFPYLCTVRAGDRATEFKQRCDGLGISGVSLHSYRYAWAECSLVSKCPKWAILDGSN